MKLANRVTWAVTGATGAALIASFAAALLLISRDETADMDHALLIQAHAFAERLLARDPERPRVSDGFANMPEALFAMPRYVALYEPSGLPISYSTNFGAAPPPLASLGVAEPPPPDGESLEFEVEGVPVRGVVLPLRDRARSILLYAAAREAIDEDLSFFRRAAAFIFVAATALTALVARFLSARIARDVVAVANVARAVAGGNLDARVGTHVGRSTEAISLAANMDHMIGQLQSLVLAQRTFVSHAAHELRSPLSTLRGELQLAIRRERTAGEYREAIHRALADVETMAALAEDLLSLARVQSAEQGEAAPVPIGTVVQAARDMARGAVTETRVSLNVRWLDAHVPQRCIPGPLTELARALRNLIDNALWQSRPGDSVDVEILGTPTDIFVRVIDRGSGVPEPERSSIFQPFFRGSNEQAGDRSGTGLGLAIAREIARKRGGDVVLTSTAEGAGSTFELRLPAASPGA